MHHRVAAGALVSGHPGRLDRGDLKLEDYQLSQWRLMHIGAQPVPPSLIKHWMRYFPHHKYDTNYGLSESTGPGCVHLGMENIHKVGAIGVPGERYGFALRVGQREVRKAVADLRVSNPASSFCSSCMIVCACIPGENAVIQGLICARRVSSCSIFGNS